MNKGIRKQLKTLIIIAISIIVILIAIFIIVSILNIQRKLTELDELAQINLHFLLCLLIAKVHIGKIKHLLAAL